MARQISVRVSPVWAKAPTKELVERVEAIIIGPRTSSFEPFEKPNSGGSWQIDSGNNWFMHMVNDSLLLTGRYANSRLMDALGEVLAWAVGAERR
jgi:hypothetical protein